MQSYHYEIFFCTTSAGIALSSVCLIKICTKICNNQNSLNFLIISNYASFVPNVVCPAHVSRYETIYFKLGNSYEIIKVYFNVDSCCRLKESTSTPHSSTVIHLIQKAKLGLR